MTEIKSGPYLCSGACVFVYVYSTVPRDAAARPGGAVGGDAGMIALINANTPSRARYTLSAQSCRRRGGVAQ